MDKKRIVVALGRNAFGETFPEQQANVKKAAKAIADLVEAKYQIVITHSNGPQVGMIQTAMTEFARLEPEDRTVAPMSVCGVMIYRMQSGRSFLTEVSIRQFQQL